MKLHTFKIGARLGLSFALLLVLMLTTTVAGIYNMTAINDRLEEIVEVNVRKMDLLQRMNGAAHTIARIMRNGVLLSDQKEIETELGAIAALRTKYDTALGELIKLPIPPEAAAIRANLKQAEDGAMALNEKVAALAKGNQDAEATEILIKQAGPANQKWQALLEEEFQLLQKENIDDKENARVGYDTAVMVMIGLIAVALIAGIAIAWSITRSITHPLNTAMTMAQAVAAGDLTHSIAVTSKDETGMLMQALKEMNESLVRIVGEVRSGTDTIATASSQIAAGTQDLSSRTEQQASSLEETASSMEELTTTVKQNAENARQANQFATSASEVAVKGGAVVEQVVATMDAINSSANKIVDIIAVIDGIAFQTNILALNAAVEAARAGEQGRGFAVVASEVRTLAQRSAAAAKEIKVLIGDSVEKVAAGTKLVDEAGTTMDEIVASVARVTDIMAEITAASGEQSSGIEQINRAIGQMDEVTQQNASLVEQAAAASESLQDRAAALAQVVSVFTLDNGQRSDHPPQAQMPGNVLPLAPALKHG